MVKNTTISIAITKSLLSLAFIQILFISFQIIPPNDNNYTFIDAALRPYIPEMIEYAVLTAVLSYPIGLVCEKILKK